MTNRFHVRIRSNERVIVSMFVTARSATKAAELAMSRVTLTPDVRRSIVGVSATLVPSPRQEVARA